MATLIDVARHAGVSPMTVSRVVRNDGPISDETRARVEQAIVATGYVPNALARSLRGLPTDTIGLVLPDLTNPFYGVLAHGVETAAREAGITMVLANSDDVEDEELRLVRLLLGRQVDGMLVATAGSGGATSRLCRKAGTNLVLVDRRPTAGKADVVRADVEEGAVTLGSLLVGLGHVHMAVLSGPASVTGGEDRIAGFQRALRAAGRPAPLVLRDHFTIESGVAMATQAMAATPRPTALFAVNNFIGIGVLHALAALGLRVPEDVAVVGFDDLPAAMVTFPFLTVAAQPAFEIGRQAVGLLLARRANPDGPPREVLLPTELVVRQSSGAPLATAAAG